MLEVGLANARAATLAELPERMRRVLSDKANLLVAALQEKINQKLSGTVLNARSGALARSITATINDTSANVSVRIAASGAVKYAAIQEFGGAIPPHQIVPDKAKALAFVLGGKQVFAARVQMPAVIMPERSYMRSSLAEMADEIQEGLQEAALGCLR